ncbi:TetR family transcriptional regulator [Nocardia macrotermitis]|uniref:HTH tetR-type domain-containing protein n=1 Tax=Nocardia macrotermitis TaxID=2585198 RepID=A0A7K0DB58_9NOCA|nr:TetR family transcriptional regulator [Nocardia macrotermitis]MQY22542.1 hypothetical protein [Nocardia macrotermitis]
MAEPPEPQQISLRDRQKARIRADIHRAALHLFAERGFDAVTTEEIAAAAGIGHSTYFRYVANKSDLLLGALHSGGAAIVANLERRPPDEAAESALAQSILERSRTFTTDEDSIRHWRTAIRGAPHLLDRVALIEPPDRARLVELVTARIGTSTPDDLRAALLVHTLLAAAEFAYQRWLSSDDPAGPTLHHLTERALDGVRNQCWR